MDLPPFLMIVALLWIIFLKEISCLTIFLENFYTVNGIWVKWTVCLITKLQRVFERRTLDQDLIKKFNLPCSFHQSMDFVSSISFPNEPLISWTFLQHFSSSKLDSRVIRTLERENLISMKKNVKEMFNWSEVHSGKEYVPLKEQGLW